MDAVLSQDHIRMFLQSHIEHPPHLMFFGPSGTGKTMMSRAFLHTYLRHHGVPDAEHGDYILSLTSVNDRGIATIRGSLTEFVRRTRRYPAAKAWVWMDDADSVPVISQQALRRILENYEKHARFLFVANGAEPFIEPLQSRCVMLQFMPVNLSIVRPSMEKVKVQDEAHSWMISMALGNARLYKLFFQMLECAGMEDVSAVEIQAIVNAPPVTQLVRLGRAALNKNQVEVLRSLLDLWSLGFCFEDIINLLEIVCKIYSYFTGDESQKLYLACGEGHIAIIMNKTRLLDAVKIFTF
jgi:replication-associated recombination protein RarA